MSAHCHQCFIALNEDSDFCSEMCYLKYVADTNNLNGDEDHEHYLPVLQEDTDSSSHTREEY